MRDSDYPFQHTAAIIARFHVGDHVALLQAIADGIGQDTLNAIARLKHDGALRGLGHQLDQESVVSVLLSQSPMLEEVGSEHAGIVLADALHRHDGNLNTQAILQQVERLVDACLVLWLDQIVGVAHMVEAIAETHVRDGLHRVVGGGKEAEVATETDP